MDKKPTVLVIAGPTASGKTALAVELAGRYDGEIISADSMQIYKGMDIATAKPTEEEKQGIPHHLMDFLECDADFSVAEYVRLANEKIAEIIQRGKFPIVAGGTGLYISSLVDNIQFEEIKTVPEYRELLRKEAREKGNAVLLERLREVDKETADTLHENNLTRIIRALEVYETTGQKLSDLKKKSCETPSPYKFIMVGLNFSDRKDLYDRIDRRVDIMLENGLLEEAEAVFSTEGLKTASQAIGYKELFPYFEGRAELSECIEKLKQYTRNYAKRQLTWFRRDNRIHWIMLEKDDDKDKILEKYEKVIANSKIL